MVEIRIIRGITERDIEDWRSNPIPNEIINKLYWGRQKRIVYRAIDPERLNVVLVYGTDRTPDYLSDYDIKDVIYAGNLVKALEYAARYMRRAGKACIVAYNEDELEKIDTYAYRPKSGKTYMDSLEGIVCLEK